jgi:predicted RND superfamily exporter protein
VVVELPEGRAADDAGRRELVEFALRFQATLGSDPEAQRLVAWARFGRDPEFARFAREVMLPSGAFYLDDAALQELVRRMRPDRVRERIARNETLIAAPGPAGGALADGVRNDPLRLFELIPSELSAAVGAGSGREGRSIGSAGGEATGFSGDGRALLIQIGGRRSSSDLDFAVQLTDAVASRASASNTTGLRVDLAGPSAIAATTSRVIRGDAIVTTLASVALLYMLFVIFYRRWMAALLIGWVAVVGILAGIGVFALFASAVSPLAAVIAALLAGLGVDYGIHFMSHYDACRAQGLDSASASIEAFRRMALPIVTNCFTSIFGFASLWPSDTQMLRDFAVMGASGLLGALASVFVLMPAMLRLFDRGSHAGVPGGPRFGGLADIVAHRPRMWMTSSLVVLSVAVGAAGLQGFIPTLESDLTVMHPRPNRALDVTGEVVTRFSGQGEFIPVEVRAESSEALVAKAHDAARALRSEACQEVGVVGVSGLHQLLPDPRGVSRALDGLAEADAERAVRSFDAALAESVFDPSYYGAYRDMLRSLLSSRQPPAVAVLSTFPSLAERLFPASALDAGTPPTDTVILVRLSSPLHDRAQRRRTMDVLDKALAPFPGVTVAGVAAVSDELEDATRASLPQAVAISVVLVIGWLLIVFRKPMDVCLALIPLVFAALATVAFMVATKQKFNPMNSVAIPLLDGIAVDAGVFLVSAARAHSGTRDGLRPHLRTTAPAVLLAATTTMTGFGALWFTHTPAIRSFGMVAAVGIFASMCGALFVLMPILFGRAKRSEQV